MKTGTCVLAGGVIRAILQFGPQTKAVQQEREGPSVASDEGEAEGADATRCVAFALPRLGFLLASLIPCFCFYLVFFLSLSQRRKCSLRYLYAFILVEPQWELGKYRVTFCAKVMASCS